MHNHPTASPHDAIFKLILSEEETARDFLQRYLPAALRPICDLSTLRLERGSFVDRELKSLHSDVLWSLQTTHGQGYIYALIEHQSSPDRHMAFRLMHYAMSAMKQHLDAGNDQLPLVIPLLFYHGKTSPYPWSLNWLQGFSDPALARQIYASDFPLVDVTVIPDDEIMRHRRTALLEFIQKHIRQRDFTEQIDQLVTLLRRGYTGRDQLSALINYLLQAGNFADAPGFLRELTGRVSQHEGDIMTGAEQFEKIGLEKGIEKGLEMGRLEGRQQGNQEGLQQGRREAREEMAQAMLANGLDRETIISITGLNTEQLAQVSP